ncbi:hypothetical protein BA190_34305 [Labrys sp. WJW]|nr:hypothetical protein BA190_34305 [Labrys sp. WJW]
MSSQTADRSRQAAEIYGRQNVYDNLSAKVLHELSSSKTPMEAREEVDPLIARSEMMSEQTGI